MKTFSSLFQKIKVYALAHKVISAVVIVVLLGGGYYVYKSATNTSGQTSYVVTNAVKGTIETTVSGTGQVSALNQIDIQPKASGQVVYVPVTDGQTVTAGQLIAELDTTDAEKAVRDAQANLDGAKISLQKLIEPADDLSISQSESSLAQAQDSAQTATDDLAKAYDDGFNNVSNAFLTLPSVMTGLHDVLYSVNNLSSSQDNSNYYADTASTYNSKALDYKADVDTKYQAALAKYNQTFSDFKATNRSSATSTIEAIIAESYDTTKSIAEAVKSANNLVQFYSDTLTQQNLKPNPIAATNLASLNTYTGNTNTFLSSLLSSQTTIQNDKQAIISANRTIAIDTLSLAKLKNGPDPLDIQSAQLTVTQRQNALLDAQNALANYYVRAPFNGVLGKINVQKGDSAGSGTTVTTLVTSQLIAEITENEVDVAKIAVGQKVNVSFDAISGLTITGKVSAIDSVGTVSQGVVTYGVKIGFDTQDDRVKPGMSVSVSIITNVKQDVLTVPNSAIKTSGNSSYVLVFNPPIAASSGNTGTVSVVPPVQQIVQVGLSGDISTEIISGLSEGDQVVTRTISPTAVKSTAASATSLLGGTRAGGLGGGAGAGRTSTTGR